ncbi:MAG: hypothetical protein JF615_10605 [Asticcacaulis sp.]|nr:hypothetical protein [Asticcacaulis sp.]
MATLHHFDHHDDHEPRRADNEGRMGLILAFVGLVGLGTYSLLSFGGFLSEAL